MFNKKISFREMIISDCQKVSEIEAQLAEAPWSLLLFEGEFDLSEAVRHWIVCEIDEQIVGYAGIKFGAGESHILNLGVKESFQRKGIGKELLLNLINEAVNRAVSFVHLEVNTKNSTAISLYLDLGFERVGLRDNYYGKDTDAVLMTKFL